MTAQDIVFAFEDCQRFIDRVKPVYEAAKENAVTETDLRNVRNLSLDVTRAMMTLRKRIEAEKPQTQPASTEHAQPAYVKPTKF
jgi:hypothetical protein